MFWVLTLKPFVAASDVATESIQFDAFYFFACICMCVWCVYVDTCESTHVYASEHVCVWRPEANISSLSCSISTVFFKAVPPDWAGTLPFQHSALPVCSRVFTSVRTAGEPLCPSGVYTDAVHPNSGPRPIAHQDVFPVPILAGFLKCIGKKTLRILQYFLISINE